VFSVGFWHLFETAEKYGVISQGYVLEAERCPTLENYKINCPSLNFILE
jgi:hypothetical protein